MAAREQRKIANAKLHKERLEKEKIEKEAFEKKKKFVDAVTAKLDNRFTIYCDSQNTVSFYFEAVTLKDLNWIGNMLGTENVSVVVYMEAPLIVVSDICLDILSL